MFDKIEKILVPTDFSEHAENAFNFALEIAHKSGASVSVVHGAKSNYSYGSDRLLAELSAKNTYENVSVETRVEVGNLGSDLLKTSADLIVVGSKGKSNLEKVLFGSVTSKLILDASIPVLAIPKDQKFSGFKHLVFTTDFNDRDLKALHQVTHFARLFDSKITLLHIADSDNLKAKAASLGFAEMVKQEIDYPEIENRILRKKDFFDGMSDFIKDQHPDLIILNRYKKPFFRSLFEKDAIKQEGYTNVPILVMPCDVFQGE